jgi:hypothetical protein
MTPDQIESQEARMDLPRPVAPQEKEEQAEQSPVLKQGTEVNPEFLPAIGATPQPAVPPVLPQGVSPGVLTSIPVPSPAQQPPTQSVPVSTPELAEDVDLIEKEWVDKAKAIVAHTKDDPHRQNKEINKIKADYIKKRYNRDIQVGE